MINLETSANLSLEERVPNFILIGDLDSDEDAVSYLCDECHNYASDNRSL